MASHATQHTIPSARGGRALRNCGSNATGTTVQNLADAHYLLKCGDYFATVLISFPEGRSS